ncbi:MULTISPECIES: hypothetical protein, partial [unclassified Chryseobacterium]
GSTLGAANFSNQMSLWQDAAGGGGSSTTDPTPKNTGPNLIQRIGNFFSNLFGGKKSTASGHAIKATVIGFELIPEGVETAEAALTLEEAMATAGVLSRGLWGLPLMLNGDSSHAHGYDIPLTGATDVPADEPEQMITLYRGVSSDYRSVTNRTIYGYAKQGTAIPKGLLETFYGVPHEDPELHARGNNNSIYTSWTVSEAMAEKFARGEGGKFPGVIMSKSFRLGTEAFPNASPTAVRLNEGEWLVIGVVQGASTRKIK